jgi:hypothetical protein
LDIAKAEEMLKGKRLNGCTVLGNIILEGHIVGMPAKYRDVIDYFYWNCPKCRLYLFIRGITNNAIEISIGRISEARLE